MSVEAPAVEHAADPVEQKFARLAGEEEHFRQFLIAELKRLQAPLPCGHPGACMGIEDGKSACLACVQQEAAVQAERNRIMRAFNEALDRVDPGRTFT
jgi:hypothetical protein